MGAFIFEGVYMRRFDPEVLPGALGTYDGSRHSAPHS